MLHKGQVNSHRFSCFSAPCDSWLISAPFHMKIQQVLHPPGLPENITSVGSRVGLKQASKLGLHYSTALFTHSTTNRTDVSSCCSPHLSRNTVNSGSTRTSAPCLAYLASGFYPAPVLSVVGLNQTTIEALDISWLRLHSFCILPLYPWQPGCHGRLAEQQVHLKALQNL